MKVTYQQTLEKNMNIKTNIILSGLILAFLLFGGCLNLKAQQKNYTSLDNSIDSLLNIGDIVSISSCIIKEDRIILSKAKGIADLKNYVPINLNTIYMLGS